MEHLPKFSGKYRVTNAPICEPIFEKGSIVDVNFFDASLFRSSHVFKDGSVLAVARDGMSYDFEPIPEEKQADFISSGVRTLTPEIAKDLVFPAPLSGKLKKEMKKYYKTQKQPKDRRLLWILLLILLFYLSQYFGWF